MCIFVSLYNVGYIYCNKNKFKEVIKYSWVWIYYTHTLSFESHAQVYIRDWVQFHHFWVIFIWYQLTRTNMVGVVFVYLRMKCYHNENGDDVEGINKLYFKGVKNFFLSNYRLIRVTLFVTLKPIISNVDWNIFVTSSCILWSHTKTQFFFLVKTDYMYIYIFFIILQIITTMTTSSLMTRRTFSDRKYILTKFLSVMIKISILMLKQQRVQWTPNATLGRLRWRGWQVNHWSKVGWGSVTEPSWFQSCVCF